MTDDLLAGKVAIVSGSARGIGAAWVDALRGAGATVVGFDVRPGADLVADASDADQVRDVVDRVVADHGGVDIAVANAGRVRLTSPLDPWDKALDDFDDQIGTNLKGVYLLGRAVAPVMVARGGGHIVNISTDHVHRAPGVRSGGGPRMDIYDASKFGVRGFDPVVGGGPAPASHQGQRAVHGGHRRRLPARVHGRAGDTRSRRDLDPSGGARASARRAHRRRPRRTDGDADRTVGRASDRAARPGRQLTTWSMRT